MSRTAIDQMIDLAKLFSREVALTKDINGRYLISIPTVWSKESRHDQMKCGISGRADSVERACADFMSEARGKLLIGDDPTFYGDKRPEYICTS